MRTSNHQALTRSRQNGAALLVMLVILITGGAYLLMNQLNRATQRIENDQQTVKALAQAKEALIGWAVSRLDPSWPGMLPHPDRNTDAPDYYDGMSDCLTGMIVGTPQLLLGKIPRVGTEPPCSGPQTPLSIDSVDAAGEVLWYAVSRNLVRGSAIAPINPNLLLAATPTYPWLTVRNSSGGVLSNRVAFLVIAPGAVVGAQNRTGLGPGPIQFLDNYTVPLSGITYSNTDFDGAYDDGAACERLTTPRFCEDFIQGDPTDTSNSFNDRLLFVTIDELMPLIEQRVALEVGQALRNFGLLPSAAALGYLGNDCGSTEGFLPLPTCECRRNGTDLRCNCPFDTPPTASITYTGVTNYTAPAIGQCAVLVPPTSCRCSGEGSCSGPTQTFQCSADGICSANNVAPATFSISYSLPSSVVGGFFSAAKTPPMPSCSISPPLTRLTMSCNNFTEAQGIVGVTCTPAQMLTGLPEWFLSNGWKHYMYYAFTPPPGSLTVGATAGVDAVVISTGTPLGIQARPSSNLNDYLDDFENSNGPPAFTGVGQPLTNMFNDQAVIVAP